MRPSPEQTEQFERHRPHLAAVAYRMLGSVTEAEDALQEAWLRLGRSRQDTIHDARAWLTTIVGRVCIDMLRARQSRGEDYVGAWVPEPIVDDQPDPEEELLMADSVGLALLVVLETLTPAERVAYVMHDIFALPFADVGRIVDRSPEAARQLASRARRRVRGAVPRPDADLAEQRELVDAFLAASRAGDFDALIAVLHPDAVFRARGGPQLRQELDGAAEVARAWATFGPRFAGLCHPSTVNGQAGLRLQLPQGLLGAVGFTAHGGRIATVDLTLDPGRLGDTEDVPLLGLLRGREGSVGRRIAGEALSWPGVRRETGEFGSLALHAGGRELGHLHGDAFADVPVPPEDDSSGWARVPLETEDGVQRALALLRANYERATSTPGPARALRPRRPPAGRSG